MVLLVVFTFSRFTLTGDSPVSRFPLHKIKNMALIWLFALFLEVSWCKDAQDTNAVMVGDNVHPFNGCCVLGPGRVQCNTDGVQCVAQFTSFLI